MFDANITKEIETNEMLANELYNKLRRCFINCATKHDTDSVWDFLETCDPHIKEIICYTYAVEKKCIAQR